MNVPDRAAQHVREWLRHSTPIPPDAEQSVDEVMTTLFQQAQLRPRISFRFWRGRARGEGRYSMFSALKVAVATALVAFVGGILALSALPQQQEPLAPAAAPTEAASPEVAIEDLPPYAAVEGRVSFGGMTNAATEVAHDLPPQITGTDWAGTLSFMTNDPRLNGHSEYSQNYHRFTGTDTGGAVESGIGRISNDDGSWAYELRGFAKPGDSSWRESHFALYLTGEGGYEGLSGMLWLDPVPGSHWELEGVIAPGPMPEPPAALVPAEPE